MKDLKKVILLVAILLFLGIIIIEYAKSGYDGEFINSSVMITEWTIDEGNTEIALPVMGMVNISIDWGDGAKSENITNEFPTHVYTNSGIYDIQVTGKFESWGSFVITHLDEKQKEYMKIYRKSLTGVKQFGELEATEYNFSNCTNLKYVDGNKLVGKETFKNVTNMGAMFFKCESLENLNLKKFDTSDVTDMTYMFLDCKKLTNLDLSYFNTSNVEKMNSMFSNCNTLVKLDLSNFNTSKVTSMEKMFSNCTSLESVNISHFDTSNVEYMSKMFSNCTSLTNLNLSNFNTSKVISTKNMFSGCSRLNKLDLDNFTSEKLTDCSEMFLGCTSLENLNLTKFNVDDVEQNGGMFENCTSLKAENVIGIDMNSLK